MMADMAKDGLEEARAEFQRCIEERDAIGAEQVLDADYALVFVHPVAAVVPRSAWLATLGDYHVHDYDVEESHTHVDGDVAAVFQRARMRATVLGQDRSGSFILSDVWRRRPEGWRVWRRHSTAVSASAYPGPVDPVG